MRMNYRTRLLGVVLFLVLLLALSYFTGLREHFSLQYLYSEFMAHRVAGLLVFILFFCAGNLIQIPGWIFLAAAVLALGELWGGIATYLAAVISCLTTFLAIRLIGADALRQVDNKLLARILARLDAHPVGSVALLRVLFQTWPTLNVALAVSGVRLRDYFLGTLLGLPLPIMLYCIFFDALARLLNLR